MNSYHLAETFHYDEEPQSSWSTFKELLFGKPKHTILTIELPKYELYRIQAFVDDINELSEGEADLSLAGFISFLLKDFLRSVREGKLKPKASYTKLMILHNEFKAPLIEESFEQVSDNRWTVIKRAVPRTLRYLQFRVEMDYRSIVRFEVFLMDLARHNEKEIEIKVPDLLALLMIEFVQELEKGITSKRLKSMMESLVTEA